MRDIYALSKKIMPTLGAGRTADKKRLSKTKVQRFAGDYLREISDLAGGALRVTDKMPHNFLYLGLIALMFPKAKIIHCLRDPMDTCVSCYMNKFTKAHAYNSDLSTLGAYYQEYRRLMNHWKDVLPLSILDLHYEETITNQDRISRQIIHYVGLPWNDACLQFYNADRDVSTLSQWQVRQPIYTTSMQRWRKYGRHLDNLKRNSVLTLPNDCQKRPNCCALTTPVSKRVPSSGSLLISVAF